MGTGITGIRRALSRDDGMSMTEVLVASAILLLIASATMSMYGVGMTSTVAAKRRTATAQVAESEMEMIRMLPYASVGVSGGNPDGELSATKPVSSNGVDMTVTTEVSWVDDPLVQGATDYKLVNLIVTAETLGGAPALSSRRSTFIRNSDTLGGDERIPPSIKWATGNTADGSIVWGTAVPVNASAETTMPSAKLVRLSFYCGSAAMRDSGGLSADWALSTKSISKSFLWDTTRLNEDGKKFSPDGTNSIKIQVSDSIGQQDYKTERLIVDNYPPPPPTPFGLSAPPAGGVVSSWSAVNDGIDPVSTYRVDIWQERKSDTTWDVKHTANTGMVTSYAWAAPAFGRFWGQAAAVSPRGLLSDTASLGSSTTVVTAPALSGTYAVSVSGNGSNKQYTTSVSLGVPTAPQFPVSGAVTYDLFRSNNPASMGTSAWKTSTVPTAYADVNTSAKGRAPSNWVYQYRVTFKPAGWPWYASNPTQSVWSKQCSTGVLTTTGTFPLK